eukprot:scaffold18164_cov112-Isochrysis_galbana.AAC.1
MHAPLQAGPLEACRVGPCPTAPGMVRALPHHAFPPAPAQSQGQTPAADDGFAAPPRAAFRPTSHAPACNPVFWTGPLSPPPPRSAHAGPIRSQASQSATRRLTACPSAFCQTCTMAECPTRNRACWSWTTWWCGQGTECPSSHRWG